ncbi:MAG TPA: NapC/NirT family cytochrome c, partial [Candidatus Eisenbacteria bacterium]
MKHLFDIGPGSPLGRWTQRVSGGRLTPRGLRIATFTAGLGLALLLVGVLFMVQVSSTPQFCGTCHIMKPYYASWQHSKHNQIACVDCHISPGIGAEVRKKYEALSMVVKYFTGTYGTNPWAEVDDAACLRCHERRLLEGKEVFHNVLFDHTPHLTETRRGLRLRCTSCHSQIVQGSHISVTSSTCALCHFKGQPINQETARCRLCHQIPQRVVMAGGTTFDHGQVGRLDMECTLCHANVVRGVGNVPRERCVTCHNDPARLRHYGDKDLLHQMHVTTHKVDCMTCHLQIEHGRPATLAAGADSAAVAAGGHGEGQTGCQTCHGAGHAPQQNLYAGLGGRGVPIMPSPMYAAGVKCEGCHNPALAAPAALAAADGASDIHIQRASDVSCMSCHGPGYRRIYQAWTESIDARVASLGHQ